VGSNGEAVTGVAAFCHPNRGQAGCGHLERRLILASSGASVPTCCHCEEYFALDWFCNWLGTVSRRSESNLDRGASLGRTRKLHLVGALSVAGFHIVRVILWKIVPAVPGVLKALLALGILVVLALLAYRIVVFAFTGRFHL